MIEIHKNFFDNSSIEFLEQEIDISRNTAQLRTSYNWHPPVVQDSAPVLIYDIPDKNIITKKLSEKIKEVVTFESIHYMIYHWPNNSYIPWHNDVLSPNSKTGTLYLNRHWTRNWGGAILFEEGDKIVAEYPEHNKLIIQKGHTAHATTPVTKPLFNARDWDSSKVMNNPECRTTLQIFMDHGQNEEKRKMNETMRGRCATG